MFFNCLIIMKTYFTKQYQIVSDHIPVPYLHYTSLIYILMSVVLPSSYLTLTTPSSSYLLTTSTSSYLSVILASSYRHHRYCYVGGTPRLTVIVPFAQLWRNCQQCPGIT